MSQRPYNYEYLVTKLETVFGSHPKKWRRTLIRNLQKASCDENSEGVGSAAGQLMQIPGEQDDRDILIMKVFMTMDEFIRPMIREWLTRNIEADRT